MYRKTKAWFTASLLAALIAGCGGGGGGGNDTQSSSTVSGVASLGPISGGMVTVYALNADGTKGGQIGTTTTTDGTGKYSVNIGTYTGNVIVEVTGGTYKDEATGETLTNSTLRAALTGVSANVSIAVTPLTEIAVQKAGTSLTKENIEQANYLVSTLVGGANIITTLPANVTDSAASSAATVDQINYGLMLAAISQMVKDGIATSPSDAMTQITSDLSDNSLNDTGSDLLTALTTFVTTNTYNQSGVTTLDGTNLDSSITFVATNTVNTENVNNADLTKAKALVTDTRNTVLSIYNYQGVGVPGVMETPFKNTANELETVIEPELSSAVERIGWILESASYVMPGSTQTFGNLLYPTYELAITVSLDETNASFTVKDGATTIDAGTLTLTKDGSGLITSGTFTSSLKTVSGKLDANLNYTGTVSSGSYTSMTFTGSMTAPGLSLDFSQSGRKLYATFAKVPDSIEPGDIYPTSISASARVTTTTAQMDGNLSIPSIIWATNGYIEEGDWQYVNNIWQPTYTCVGEMRPANGTFTGTFQELKDGATTGVKFSGTITGTYENASTYDGCVNAPDSSTNFEKWNASFDGKIEAPSRPTITTFLKAARTELNKTTVDANYKRTNTDGTVISLSGNGEIQTYEDQYGYDYDVLTASLTNQDGMKVSFTNDDSKSGDDKFSGTITTSGGTKEADLYTINGAPMVKYSDGYFESMF